MRRRTLVRNKFTIPSCYFSNPSTKRWSVVERGLIPTTISRRPWLAGIQRTPPPQDGASSSGANTGIGFGGDGSSMQVRRSCSVPEMKGRASGHPASSTEDPRVPSRSNTSISAISIWSETPPVTSSEPDRLDRLILNAAVVIPPLGRSAQG